MDTTHTMGTKGYMMKTNVRYGETACEGYQR